MVVVGEWSVYKRSSWNFILVSWVITLSHFLVHELSAKQTKRWEQPKGLLLKPLSMVSNLGHFRAGNPNFFISHLSPSGFTVDPSTLLS